VSSNSINRNGGSYTSDFNDLGGVSLQPKRSIMRTQLLPGELEASLPSRTDLPEGAVAPLTRFLGPLLTVANPAWVGDPVPRMRALQKALVAHSLTLAEDDRSPLMGAISVVETAVQWRLRLQQMRMTEAEMNIKPQEVKKP
jgi:hypothetical protein